MVSFSSVTADVTLILYGSRTTVTNLLSLFDSFALSPAHPAAGSHFKRTTFRRDIVAGNRLCQSVTRVFSCCQLAKGVAGTEVAR